MASRIAPRPALARWTESALFLLIAAALVAGAQLIAARAGNGLERYRMDQLAGRAAIDAAASLREAYCRELGAGLGTPSCRPPAGVIDEAPPPAAFEAFAHRLVARHTALDAALAALARDGVDWRLVSEAYAAGPVDETLQGRLRQAWVELERVKEAEQEAAQVVRRLDRAALARAVTQAREAYADAVQRDDWPAAGQALLRWAQLLDGDGRGAGAQTVARLLEAGPIAERARRAEVLVRNGAIVWAALALWLGLAALLGRRPVRPLPTLALLLALALALAGAGDRWLDLRQPPSVYWITAALAALALLADQWAARRGWHWADRQMRRTAASAWLLPGWFAFVGIGWLVLADLSLNFHPRLRFLVVDHSVGVFAAVLLLGLLPLLAAQAVRTLAAGLGRAGLPTPGGRVLGLGILALVPVAAWLAAGDALRLPQHYTGEAFKAVAVVYAAWFLLVRAPLLRSGALTGTPRAALTACLPAALALAAVAAAFAITRDLGPLLVVLLCVLIWSGAFLGWRLMLAALAAGIGALFVGGGLVSPIVAERVRSVLDPYTSQTDDLARLLWFHQEVPPTGFGLGQAPWCGYGSEERCIGLPLQTQSDYTFTALVGVAGDGAWLVVAALGLWAVVLMRSRWETAVHPLALLAHPQGFHEGLRAWLAVTLGTLVVVQLASTVAGNLAWLPLSGITVPFVSFGTTALLTMTALFALLAEKAAPTGEARHA